MQNVEPTWGVVATVDEPPQLVCAFIAHHLSIGAREVHIFLDAPNPEIERVAAPLSGVFITRCDDAYWAATPRGLRPPRHTARQKYNATSVYRATSLDWLLHCDADEYLLPDPSMLKELAGSHADDGYFHIANIERSYAPGPLPGHIFGGLFRTSMSGYAQLGPDIYGAYAEYLNGGLTGHRAGKSMTPTGMPYAIDIHYPSLGKRGERQRLPHRTAQQMVLMHFDGMTMLHWALKMLKRAYEPVTVPSRFTGKTRPLQFSKMREIAADAAAVTEFCRAMKGLTEQQREALDAQYVLVDQQFDPAPAVERYFPGAGIDLSCAAFDEGLRARDAAFLAETGLAL